MPQRNPLEDLPDADIAELLDISYRVAEEQGANRRLEVLREAARRLRARRGETMLPKRGEMLIGPGGCACGWYGRHVVGELCPGCEGEITWPYDPLEPPQVVLKVPEGMIDEALDECEAIMGTRDLHQLLEDEVGKGIDEKETPPRERWRFETDLPGLEKAMIEVGRKLEEGEGEEPPEKNAVEMVLDEFYDRVFLEKDMLTGDGGIKERGDWSDGEPSGSVGLLAGRREGKPPQEQCGAPEPVGLLSDCEGDRCTCYEGSVGCLGPPCVEEPPEVADEPLEIDWQALGEIEARALARRSRALPSLFTAEQEKRLAGKREEGTP